ncbi:MAG: histidine kinase [Myxococcales bacterium]|nr:histidine kinase [Myxococcales bacterium]
MTAPATLGRGLGRSFAVATVLGMIVFATVVFLVIWVTENGEECSPGVLEDPPIEIAKQCGLALGIALPFGIGLSVLVGRRLTRTTTERLDDVIVSASRMTGENLDERLPVTGDRDPLDRLATALNGVLERVASGVAAQRQFAADASHELRTPLTVISTNLEVARRRVRDTPHWEHVADDTLAEVRRMNVLVEKLLVLSRAGAAGLHHERRELRALAAVAIERSSALCAERGIRTELAPGTPAHCEIDADAISIVLDNLLRNAIDHSPKGGAITVRVKGAQITVEDQGPGVPLDIRDRIFEPFARGGHTDRAVGTGLGLGLAICKRIVKGHHGQIDVDDRPGGGARFIVTLPDA